MTISEKAAYLKGLMDGLNLDTDKAEGKMIHAIVDLLGDVTKRLSDVEETTINICDELDEIESDLDAIEDYLIDEEDDDFDWDDIEDFDDIDDCDCDECDCDECDCDDCEDECDDCDCDDECDCDDIVYEVECTCGNVIEFSESTLEQGSIICDKCGETLEFTFEDEDE